jgi:RHS repeat-associated protein
VTPTLSGYTFAPPSRSYSNVTASVTGQDFSATPGTGAAVISYIHADHLNSPRLITNQAGQAVWRWEQSDPFGGNVPNENPSGLGAFTCNLRLPGQYFDNETNLHYNYFRDYDPGIGRYVQSDPIGLAGGINTYSYVGNNPLSFTDPTGEAGGAGLGIVGIVGLTCLRLPQLCATGVRVLGTLILGAGVGVVAKSCSGDEPGRIPDPLRVKKCKEAFLACLNDFSIPEDLCFQAYDTCVKTTVPMIFPGGGSVK